MNSVYDFPYKNSFLALLYIALYSLYSAAFYFLRWFIYFPPTKQGRIIEWSQWYVESLKKAEARGPKASAPFLPKGETPWYMRENAPLYPLTFEPQDKRFEVTGEYWFQFSTRFSILFLSGYVHIWFLKDIFLIAINQLFPNITHVQTNTLHSFS